MLRVCVLDLAGTLEGEYDAVTIANYSPESLAAWGATWVIQVVSGWAHAGPARIHGVQMHFRVYVVVLVSVSLLHLVRVVYLDEHLDASCTEVRFPWYCGIRIAVVGSGASIHL